MVQTRCQLQIIERSRGQLVYKEIQNDWVRLVIKYGEENYSMTVIEMKENVLRAYKKWNPPETEELLLAVMLKPRTATKLREYMYRVNTAIEIALLWFELERAVVYMTPKGADIKFWKLDLDEPDKRQKDLDKPDKRQKRRPITQILSRLKPRLFS